MKHIAVAPLLLSAFLSCAQADPPGPRAVVEAKFRAVNRHAVSEVVAFYADEAELTASNFCAPRRGRADVQRTYESLLARFPDLVADVHEYVADGERVAVRFTVRATADGRPFAVLIANFFSVRGGLIVRDDGLFDTGGRPCLP